jgi:hypothetical protein
MRTSFFSIVDAVFWSIQVFYSKENLYLIKFISVKIKKFDRDKLLSDLSKKQKGECLFDIK